MFSARVFPSGNPTLILGGLRVPTHERFIELHFHHLTSGQASSIIHSAVSFRIVLFCKATTVEGRETLFLSLFSSEGSNPSSGRLARRVLEHYFFIWHQAKFLPSPTTQSPSKTMLFCRAVAGVGLVDLKGPY